MNKILKHDKKRNDFVSKTIEKSKHMKSIITNLVHKNTKMRMTNYTKQH